MIRWCRFYWHYLPRKTAELAVTCAEKVDKEIENVTPELAKAIEHLGDRHALNRGIHRKMHLDEIEVLLKAKMDG